MRHPRQTTTLTAVDCEAVISNYGAQLLRLTPFSGVPVVDHFPDSDSMSAQNIRGGVPICFPWFGTPVASSISLPANAPSHGFVRNTLWEEVTSNEYSTHYRLQHRPHSRTPQSNSEQYFPHAFDANVEYFLSSDLVITLNVTNTDDHEWAFEAALHSYFIVGDLKDTQVFGLEGEPYYDAIKERHATQYTEEVTFVSEMNRVYRSSCPITIEDPRFRRRIMIETENTHSVIIWTPWQNGVRTIPDIPNDAWDKFVCVEVGNVWDDAVILQPGETHSMSMRISSDALI